MRRCTIKAGQRTIAQCILRTREYDPRCRYRPVALRA